MAANQWVNTNTPRAPYVSPAPPPIQVQPEPNYYKPKSQHTIDYTVRENYSLSAICFLKE